MKSQAGRGFIYDFNAMKATLARLYIILRFLLSCNLYTCYYIEMFFRELVESIMCSANIAFLLGSKDKLPHGKTRVMVKICGSGCLLDRE